MRSFEELLPVFMLFGRAMVKYAVIDRRPHDFGAGGELYPSEIHMVSAVAGRGPVGVTELARDLGVTKGAVSQVVSKLVAKGLLVKEPDPENRARVAVRATELGRAAGDNHLAFHRDHDRAFLEYLAGLDPDAYATVERLALEMNRWMDGYPE